VLDARWYDGVARCEKSRAFSMGWRAPGRLARLGRQTWEPGVPTTLSKKFWTSSAKFLAAGELGTDHEHFISGCSCHAPSSFSRPKCNPHGIIFAATDAAMCLGPLEGLPTVREKVLGKWEFAQEWDARDAPIFVHPGIYSFHDCKGKEHTKTRGFKIDLARNFMMREIVRAWKAGDKYFLVEKNGRRKPIPKQLLNEVRLSKKKGETIVGENKLPMETTIFMTLGWP
jgi:hypothetical protein